MPEISVESTRTIAVTVLTAPVVEVALDPSPEVEMVAAGNIGPPGPPGEWTRLTQAEYDALANKDPDMLYVIIG